MKKSAKKKTHRSNCMKPNKLTAILGGISCILLVALGCMLFFLPEAQPAVPETLPPTEAPVTVAPTVPVESEVPTETVPEESEEIVGPTIEVVGGETIPGVMLENMATLHQKNADFHGWIKIADTNIDNPVMYTPGEGFKYLYKNFEGRFKYRGELFIDEACSLDPESQVILIHGHNMDDGSMFADLLNYKSQTYWEKHPTITFSTLYEERTYQIFAAFRDQIHDESKDVYRYYEFIDPATEEAFNEGIAYFKSNTKYDMGVDVAYGDSLLMLSTCDRTIAEGRFVVVAKLVTE